jgi:hypothetical protein
MKTTGLLDDTTINHAVVSVTRSQALVMAVFAELYPFIHTHGLRLGDEGNQPRRVVDAIQDALKMDVER